MKKGFTLAEVLITLVIIGIVAAITVPMLVQNNQKQELYSSFRKTYNTLNQAIYLAAAQGNIPTNFDFEATAGSAAKAQEFLDTYIKPYVKAIKSAPCIGMQEQNPTVKNLAGVNMGTACELGSMFYASEGLVLADGSIIAVIGTGKPNAAEMVVDTNGAKGPNVYGRDILNLRYFGKTKTPVITGASYTANYNGTLSFNSSYYENSCDPSNKNATGTPGDTCADRLLKEGKMAY